MCEPVVTLHPIGVGYPIQASSKTRVHRHFLQVGRCANQSGSRPKLGSINTPPRTNLTKTLDILLTLKLQLELQLWSPTHQSPTGRASNLQHTFPDPSLKSGFLLIGMPSQSLEHTIADRPPWGHFPLPKIQSIDFKTQPSASHRGGGRSLWQLNQITQNQRIWVKPPNPIRHRGGHFSFVPG